MRSAAFVQSLRGRLWAGLGISAGEGLRAKRNPTYSLPRGVPCWSQPTAYSLALALLFSANASAANWEIAPRLEGGYKYNDNYRLDLPGQEIDIAGAEVDAQVTFRTVAPRSTFSVTPRLRSTYFPDERDEDSNDYFLGARFDDATPRRRTGFKAEFAREDVVRSELPSADITSELGQAETIDAGRTLQRNRRDLIHLQPYFSYDLSQRHLLDLAAHYTDATFDRTFVNGQQDFRQYGASAGWGFRTTQRSLMTVRGFATQYETLRDADAYGGDVEWSTDLSQTSRTYIRVGAQQTTPDGGDSDTSIVAGVGGRWTTPRNQLFLDFTRSVGAASGGTVIERHQLRVRIDHDVSPRVAVLVGARVSRDESLNDASLYPKREYATAETGLEWRWSRAWSLRATYNYRWQDYEDEPSDTSANGFLISFVYEPKRPE